MLNRDGKTRIGSNELYDDLIVSDRSKNDNYNIYI